MGPGSYEAPKLIGSNVRGGSRKRNFPSYSIGQPRLPNVVNPGTRNTIGMKHTTPPPDRYRPPSDNKNFHKSMVSHTHNESKFFEQKNMPVIKQQVPIQYTAADGVSPNLEEIGAHNRGSSMSQYHGGKHTTLYRQVAIGHGTKSDFTT